MNGFVENVLSERKNKPSAFIPGFEMKGSLLEEEMKEVQERAVGLGVQRMNGGVGDRSGGQDGERDLMGASEQLLKSPRLALIRAPGTEKAPSSPGSGKMECSCLCHKEGNEKVTPGIVDMMNPCGLTTSPNVLIATFDGL